MIISYYCSSCKKDNYIKTKTTNRFDLERELGSDEIARNCDHCGTFEKKHLNRLHAEPAKYVLWLCISLAIVLTMLVFYFGFIAVITVSLPIWIYFEAQKRASQFNKAVLTRRLKK